MNPRNATPLLLAAALLAGFRRRRRGGTGQRAGGRTVGGFGGFTRDNAFGGSTTHSWYGGTGHTNRFGGTTTGAYGMGAVHTTAGGFTTYPSTGLWLRRLSPYYRPVGVPYYHPGCYYDCGGAVAAGAAVGLAAGAVAGAAIARANTIPAYPLGADFSTLPAGATCRPRRRHVLPQVGGSWFGLPSGPTASTTASSRRPDGLPSRTRPQEQAHAPSRSFHRHPAGRGHRCGLRVAVGRGAGCTFAQDAWRFEIVSLPLGAGHLVGSSAQGRSADLVVRDAAAVDIGRAGRQRGKVGAQRVGRDGVGPCDRRALRRPVVLLAWLYGAAGQ